MKRLNKSNSNKQEMTNMQQLSKWKN